MRRVVITGTGFLSSLGHDEETLWNSLLAKKNCVVDMPEWHEIAGLNTTLAAPVREFSLPKDSYTRKTTRSMGRLSKMATRATEFALTSAGLIGDKELSSCGIAYGSCSGSEESMLGLCHVLEQKHTNDLDANSYVKAMPHTTAVNISLFFGLQGRVITTSSACTSSSQAVGYAYESIAFGMQDLMVAGGAESLSVSQTAVFDTLFATTQKGETPAKTPAPFDSSRDGLVVGEGAATVVLEEYEHAKARGAHILAEVVGFATNCDASHITQPRKETIALCMKKALENAGLAASDVGYINAHGTGTTRGDQAESLATQEIYGSQLPISSLKSYTGHTLGACGALELITTLLMQRKKQFIPTLNLEHPDPECGALDYIMHDFRNIDTEFVATNNFAFGGINTSLLLKAL